MADSNSQNNQMSEDDEDQNLDSYEKNDSFIANSEDDSAEQDRKRRKHKKHRREKVEDIKSSLSEDDLELIQENLNKTGNRRGGRLKKNKQTIDSDDDMSLEADDDSADLQQKRPKVQNSYDSEEDDSFNESEIQEKKQSRKQKQQRYSQAQDQDSYSDIEDELGEDEMKRNFFDPTEQKDTYTTETDIKIRDTDKPERLQLRYKDCEKPSEKELEFETNWIYDQMAGQYFKNLQQKLLVCKRIQKVLEFLRIDYYEVMFIFFYKKNEIMPELNLEMLWKIYELDAEWFQYNRLKQYLFTEFKQYEETVLKSGLNKYVLSPLVTNHLDECKNQDQLKALKNYINFQNFQLALEVGQESQNLSRDLKLMQTLKKNNIDKIVEQTVMDPDTLANNLLNPQSIRQQSILQIDKIPREIIPNYLNYQEPLLDTQMKVLQAIAKYAAIQLANHPMICYYALMKYKQKAIISTQPTDKGIKVLDMLHPLYRVKRIQNCDIDQFHNFFNFVEVLKAEKLGLITVHIMQKWEGKADGSNEKILDDDAQTKGDNLKQFTQDMKNNCDIFKKLSAYYKQTTSNTEQKEVLEQKWNIVRDEVLKILIQNYLYPMCKKQIKKQLKQKSESIIIKDMEDKFYKCLMTAPWQQKSLNDKDEEQLPFEHAKIMSAVLTPDNKLALVFIDEVGEVQDKFILKSYMRRDSQESVTDRQKLDKAISINKPAMIVVAANNIKARIIKRQMLDSYMQKEKHQYVKWVSFGDDTIPQMIARQNIIKSNDQEEIRVGISLARFVQNPYIEALNLWNEEPSKNGCLKIPFHPLQDQLNLADLQKSFEKIAVQAVNEIGVDINSILEVEHQENILQFVCGLGPRKAKHMINTLKYDKEVSNNKYAQYLDCRIALLLHEKTSREGKCKLAEKNIYINCSGFLVIYSKNNPLDKTRIHPDNYNLTYKICQDACEFEDKDRIKATQKVMYGPQILEDLDFEEYATHLSRVKNKDNMMFLLNFIMEELTNPFQDKRGQYRELTEERLFYKLSKENPDTFKKHSIVSCKVEKYKNQKIFTRILDNNLKGIIMDKDIDDSQIDRKILKNKESKYEFQESDFPPGKILKCIVKKIKVLQQKDNNEANNNKFDDYLTVELTALMATASYWQNATSDILPKYYREDNKSYVQPPFLVIPKQDYPLFLVEKVEKKEIQQRKINHSKFKHMSLQSAIEYVKKQNNGDFIIRQSSQGIDYLSITWKFFKDCIVHIPIKIEQVSQFVVKYKLNNDEYENLDQIIETVINPINLTMQEKIIDHKKFSSDNQETIERELKELKQKDEKTIHYKFGCFKNTPQHIVLLYTPKLDTIQREYIKIKEFGIYFHDQYFQNLDQLIQNFKQNFKTEEYRKYVKKHKNHQFEKEQNSGMSNRSEGFNLSSQQVKYEKFEGKNEYQKYSKCMSCGVTGHTAKYCTQANGSNQNQMQCFNCNEYGHSKMNCPKKGYNSSMRSGSYHNSRQSQSQNRERPQFNRSIGRSRSRDNYNN